METTTARVEAPYACTLLGERAPRGMSADGLMHVFLIKTTRKLIFIVSVMNEIDSSPHLNVE